MKLKITPTTPSTTEELLAAIEAELSAAKVKISRTPRGRIVLDAPDDVDVERLIGSVLMDRGLSLEQVNELSVSPPFQDLLKGRKPPP